MVTPNQLKAWDPGRLEEISDDLVGHRKALLNQSDELAAGRVPASWTMESAIAAHRSYQQLADALATQVAEVAAVINALDAAATAIRAAKQDLTGAYYAAASNELRIDGATGAVRMTRSYETSEDAAHAAIQQNYVTGQVEDALAAAERADQALAAALSAAVTKDTNTIGTLDQQREIMQFVEMSITAQVTYLLAHPESYALLDMYTSDEVKERLGDAVADHLGQVARDEMLFRDPAWAQRSSELLAGFGDDPAVMAATYTSMGADGLMATLGGIASTMATDGTSYEALHVLADELRAGLETASEHPGFDGEAYGRNLVEYATYTDRGPIHGPTGDTNASGRIASLDFLLREGEYGESFVRGMAWELDEFERANPVLAAHLSGMDSYDSPLNHLDGAGSGYQAYQCDPMAQVMGQLAHHPDLGLEFFTDGPDADARTDYYFAERDWTRDHFTGISEMALAVGTDPHNFASDAEATSRFVSACFDGLAENPAFTAENAAGAAEPVANLLKHYTPAVALATSTAEAEDMTARVQEINGEYLPRFEQYPFLDKYDLTRLLDVALTSDEGMARMAEAVADYRLQRLEYFHDAYPDASENTVGLGNVLDECAQMEGHIQGVAGNAAIHAAQSADHRMGAFTNLVTQALKAVPIPGAGIAGDFGNNVARALWNETAQIPGQIVTDTVGNREAAALALTASNEDEANDGMVINTYLALVNAGILDVAPGEMDQWMPDGQLVTLTDPGIDTFELRKDAADGMINLVTLSNLKDSYERGIEAVR